MYTKEFDSWNTEKQKLERITPKVFYPRARQIWYIKLGVNIGHEADGKGEFTRPVLVIKKIGSLFRCIPLTSKGKDNAFHYRIPGIVFGNKISYVMLSQARIVDIKRFEEMVGYIPEIEYDYIKNLLKDMYL